MEKEPRMEMESHRAVGDNEVLEGQGGADGSGDQGRGGDPEDHSGVGVTEDKGGAGGKEKPDGDRWMDGRGEAGGVEWTEVESETPQGRDRVSSHLGRAGDWKARGESEQPDSAG